MATLPTGDHAKYFATAKAKGKAKPKPKPKPWDPFNQPLPSLEAIRAEARQAALADIQSLLGAIPNEAGIRSRADASIGAIGTQAQQASDAISRLAQFGVGEGNQGAVNLRNAGAVSANEAGVSAAPGGGINPNLAGSVADLLAGQSAATGNILNATAAGTVQGGLAQQGAIQRTLLDDLNKRAEAEAAAKAQKGSLTNQYLQKLREFYLGIAGSQMQSQLAASELDLNAAKAQADAQNDAARLALDKSKFKTNTQISLEKLRQGARGLDLEAGRLALAEGTEGFNQWYDQQKLEVSRWSNRIKQGQLNLAIEKAKQTGKAVKRPDVTKVFNTIDSMFAQKNKSKKQEVTTQEYIFYAQNAGLDPLKPAVKAVVVRGKNFEDAFTAAKAKAMSDGYQIPSNWKQNVGTPEDNGYGPAFRNERRNEKTISIPIETSKYNPTQILNASLVRLQALGYTRAEAMSIAGPYIQSLEPMFNLNQFYYDARNRRGVDRAG